MSAVNAPLIQAYQVPGTNTLVFTATTRTRIDAATLYNPVGNATTLVTLSILPVGGSITAVDQIGSYNCMAGIPVIAFAMIGQSLNIGDAIYAQAGTASLVNLFVSGLETT